MIRMNSSDSFSTDSDVFDVERSSAEYSPPRNNTPDILNSTELSGAPAKEAITMSSVNSLGTKIVTLESDSNGPTMPIGYARQQSIIPPSVKNLNLPINPFKVMTPISPAPITKGQTHPPQTNDIPIQEDVFDVSDISTPSLLVSSVNA